MKTHLETSLVIKNKGCPPLDQRIPNFQFSICHFSFLIFFSVATALFDLRASLKKQSKKWLV